jgi:catechol 2,3-dioxygenase-like lactoylglutathione lyase family enzyme
VIAHRGLRHLALRVTDVARAREFYGRVFGMRIVWQPDPDTAYLSSGCDNLALHRGDSQAVTDRSHQALDHLGFVAGTIAEVEAAYAWAAANGEKIAKPLAHHRDGSVSFYLRDPDDNVIQILFEPTISSQRFTSQKV